MAIQGLFYGLDAATLATLKTNWLACVNAIAVAGQSYSISGRTFTRANLAEASQMLAEVQAAIDRLDGTRTTQIYPRFGTY
jgi:bifunctional pyridoxal-dependent enzyme with beta-cystathionase and maltose regulon repressor activities